MTTRRIPQNHRWTGPYLGSYYGDLWKTFNVDLDKNEGMIGLSRRMERIEDTTELPDLATNPITAFVRTDADCEDRYWALNRGALFKTDSSSRPSPDKDWDTDGTASSPGTFLVDMAVHGNDSRNDSGRNKLFVTHDTDISVLNDTGNNAWTANWWVTKQGQPHLDSTVEYHPIEYFPLRKISLVGDGNLVHTISRPSDTQNDTVTYGRLVLPKEYEIRSIFTTTSRAWICCYSNRSEKGAVVEWDGSTQTYNQIHGVYGFGAVTGVNYGETPIVLNNKGVFLEFSGQGFVPMYRNGNKIEFPCAEEPGNAVWDSLASDLSQEVYVAPRGMVVGEDRNIYINVAGSAQPSPRHSGGIWCLNPVSGRLYNKHSLGAWGDSADYGAESAYLGRIGALYWVPDNTTTRNLLAGGVTYAHVNSASSPNVGGLWLLEEPTSTTPTRGYFITQYISANEVRELWDTLWTRFKGFITTGNRIVIKARGVRPLVVSGGAPLEKNITWTSTTQFTVTFAAADDSIAVGDEVEIRYGLNQGYRGHITTISGAHAALQTVTIDETVASSTAASSPHSSARFERWKKLGTITDVNIYEKMVNIGIDSSFIQFKVEMRGPAREMEISDLTVVSKSSIQLEN